MKKVIIIGLLFLVSCEDEKNIYDDKPSQEVQCSEEEPYLCEVDIYKYCCPGTPRYCGENYECYSEVVESGKTSSNCDFKWVYCEIMDLCCPQDRPYCTRTRMCVESNTISIGKKMNKCTIKPCVYQPSEDEWFCPKCGSKEDFVNDTDYDEGCQNDDCNLIHEKDFISCWKCGYDTNGKAFTNKLVKEKNLEKCLCCKGKGSVTREQNESYRLLLEKNKD